ncbi:MAG: hypothetical protein RL173_1800 [Fibrobacterota bacterium]|jgi:23S rRNA (uracil1939-C5)-methyltransferase
MTDISALKSDSGCRHFPLCGGCSFLAHTYVEECYRKESRVRDLLFPLGCKVERIVPSPRQDDWRHKVQLPFGRIKSGNGHIPSLGCYAQGSHDVVDQKECRIQDQALSKVAWAVRAWATREGIPVYDERKGNGFLRHLLLRKAQSSGEIILGLVCNGPRPMHYRALLKSLLPAIEKALKGTDGKLVGVIQNINERETNVVLGDQEVSWWGRNWIKEKLGDYTFHVELSTFFQVNPYQTPAMYNLAKVAIPKGAKALDAYCGMGTIAMWISDRAGEVLGVESNPRSIQAARAAVQANNVKNVDFVCGDAAELMPKLVHEGWDVVVLDPPRKGLDERTLASLIEAKIRRIVYVSCNPNTLARDMELLNEVYKPLYATPIDMFPRTEHVETVAVFQLREPAEA